MTELAAILAVWIGILGAPTLGVAAVSHRSSTGRWPRPMRALRRADWQPLWALVRRRWWRWRASIASEDEPGRRLLAFLVSGGLILRAGIHAAAAVAVRDEPEVDHGLCWTPVQLPLGLEWSCRVVCVLLGLGVAVQAQSMIWPGPPIATTAGRAFVAANAAMLAGDVVAFGVERARRKHDNSGQQPNTMTQTRTDESRTADDRTGLTGTEAD